jgi:hypothetical protein
VSEVEAAFAAGMAAAQREQDAMPGTAETPLEPPADSYQQPYIPPPMGGEDAGGVT